MMVEIDAHESVIDAMRDVAEEAGVSLDAAIEAALTRYVAFGDARDELVSILKNLAQGE